MNREEWLQQASAILAEGLFAPAGYTVPDVRVSTGFPGGGSKRKRIGECWTGEAAEDGLCQIFISPILKGDTDVAATLAHELVHAAVGIAAGHKAPFKRCALAIGLEGKMTATVPSEKMAQWIDANVVGKIGPYPHAKLNIGLGKKQSTRMVKCQCSECGYVARTTRKWLDEVGAPLCACNSEPMEVTP